ncbi:hypothetical protein SMRA8_1770 [Stenotrophomonas maltophilia RA8]|uniref:hypothetical protein n=1 Tax=Stenotrophomonas maltophilia TaxID=40324 RepID=UPI0002C52D59|nr:hypothetical protein [Stenotrophomonas maltophilia]CCP15836.1 hypothetical protein SMRA8_1770 [Stenotrophomonas maltophilia RA8]
MSNERSHYNGQNGNGYQPLHGAPTPPPGPEVGAPTLADVQPGGRVRLPDQAERARFEAFLSRNPLMALCAGTAWQVWQAALSAQPSPGGQDALAEAAHRVISDIDSGDYHGEISEATYTALQAALAARQPVGQSFQAGAAEWMGQCFLPSLYSNMTERGDRLLEEVLELLQAHGYDKARVPTLVDYVFGRPVGDPAQEVGGVMVTLAGYCWVAGLDMHAAGDAELARINQPEVMAKIRAKQEAKNALHFDTPLPGDAGVSAEEWPREGDLVRYDAGSSALAIRLEPHAGGWHGYQCCGGYTFFTKAYRPSRADMDTWLDCAKYRDERTKVADNHVAHEMYLLDHQAEVTHG